MKVCFDTNVIVDIWGRYEDFSDSFCSLDVTLAKELEPCISVGSLSDLSYLLVARKHVSKQRIRHVMSEVLDVFELLDLTAADCHRANESEMDDFEDALIACSAYRCGVDMIVTRNKRDFVKSPVPAMTPHEFVALYEPEGVSYGMARL